MRPAIRMVVIGAALTATAAPTGTRADEVDNLATRVVELEAKVRELDIQLKPSASVGETAERRLIDAQVLYELKNYEAASIILLDVVEKYPKSSAHPEALYFLADALYLERDYLSARRYYERLVALGPQARRYQEALERLIELSLYTGDSKPIEGYFAKLAELPTGSQLPTVPYVKGKYLFSAKRYDEAAEIFQAIAAAESPYWFQSQYFLGAARVAQGKLPEAVTIFEDLLKRSPRSDSDKKIIELSHLALARIYYQQEHLPEASTEYSVVSQDSSQFSDSLYEQAWVAVKDKNFKKAFLSLDLLLTVKPEGPQVPELKLLIGNLRIRQGQWDEATATFSTTRSEFDGIRQQMEDALKKQGDPVAYFRDLIGKNPDKFDLMTTLPPAAAKWVQRGPDVEKLSGLLGDVSELRKSLDESEEILHRLERALEGPAKVNIYPELAHAKAQATEAVNQLYDIEHQLLQKQRELLGPVIAATERSEIERVIQERQDLEKRLGDLPRGDNASYEDRIFAARASFDELDKKLVELNVQIASYAAERVAIEKYFHDTGQDQKPEVSATFAGQLGELKAYEDELNRTYADLRRQISDTSQGVGVDDVQMQAEEQLKKQLAGTMAREHDLLAGVAGRLSGNDRAKAEQIFSILERAHGAQRSIAQFSGRIDGLIEDRLRDIKVTVADEKTKVAQYRQVLGAYQGEAVDVGGEVSAKGYKDIADRFYQIVVRSDVGIIDVAWALKQNRTDDNSRLTREKKRELKLLDDEFKEVLKE